MKGPEEFHPQAKKDNRGLSVSIWILGVREEKISLLINGIFNTQDYISHKLSIYTASTVWELPAGEINIKIDTRPNI